MWTRDSPNIDSHSLILELDFDMIRLNSNMYKLLHKKASGRHHMSNPLDRAELHLIPQVGLDPQSFLVRGILANIHGKMQMWFILIKKRSDHLLSR